MNSLEEIALKITEDINLKYSDLNGDDLALFVTELARRLVAALGAQKAVGATDDYGNPMAFREGEEVGEFPPRTKLFAAPVLPSVPEGMILVKTVKCPNCDDVGWYVVPGRDGEPEQEQCEFCEMVPNSIFNISKIAILSAAPSPQEDAK